MEAEWIDQTNRMAQVCAELSLLSYASAAQLGSAQCRQKPSGGNRPPGDPNPLHILYWERFVSKRTFDAREQVISDATDALIEARVRTTPIPVGETREEWVQRLIVDGEGWPARDIAVRFLTGVREVIRLRKEYSRDPSDGRPVDVMPSVRELAGRGFSARQIALVCGVSAQNAQYHVTQARKQVA